jgi:hypothetical protein
MTSRNMTSLISAESSERLSKPLLPLHPPALIQEKEPSKAQ